jgi:hypothetical protein
MIHHRDQIIVDGKITLQQNDLPKGHLCLTVQYQFDGHTKETAGNRIEAKNICETVQIENGAFTLESIAEFYLPYNSTKLLGVENISFTTQQMTSEIEGYQLQKIYRGKLANFTKTAGRLQLQLEFQFDKKVPVAELAAVIEGCQKHIHSRYQNDCIAWRIAPALAAACGRLSFNNQYSCLVEARRK